MGLLGENGAGKTTLMSILFGHYVADEGTIEVAGSDGVLRPLPPGSPKAALAAGIGMVHQHFTLADNLSGLDNIVLGTRPLLSLSRSAVPPGASCAGSWAAPDSTSTSTGRCAAFRSASGSGSRS